MLYEMRALTSGPEPLIVLDRIGARVPRERTTTNLADMHVLAARTDVASRATLLDRTELLFTTLARPLRADPLFMTLAKRLGLLAVC